MALQDTDRRRRHRAGTQSAALKSSMPKPVHPPQGTDGPDDEVLAELIRRVQDIGTNYREAARKIGQLYMYADQHDHAALTRSLDKPMRTASANERALAAILDELLVNANRRKQRKHLR
jgi:hypothetical protein